MNHKKVIVTIEARMTSSRLPGKVLLESCGKPLLQHMIERLRRCHMIEDIVVATTVNQADDPIVALCDKIGCKYFRGSEDDVLIRVLLAAQSVNADVIVEATGDCPLIDWRHIDYLVNLYNDNQYDFVANNIECSFPDGFDIRIFSTVALDQINCLTQDSTDHEHVSIFFPRHPELFSSYNWMAEGVENRPDLEITLDERGDYEFINSIYEGLYADNNDFSCKDVINYIEMNPQLLEYVKGIKRTIVE